jgi:hypothetical protein
MEGAVALDLLDQDEESFLLHLLMRGAGWPSTKGKQVGASPLLLQRIGSCSFTRFRGCGRDYLNASFALSHTNPPNQLIWP